MSTGGKLCVWSCAVAFKPLSVAIHGSSPHEDKVPVKLLKKRFAVLDETNILVVILTPDEF